MKQIFIIVLAGMFANFANASEAELRQELEQVKRQLEVLTEKMEESASPSAQNSKQSKLSFGGYGEHHLNIVKDEDNTIDAHRFVMFTGYQFNDKVSFQSELEVEHAFVGENEEGKVELEQAFINIKATPNTDVKIGQFLVPVGIINETHEPNTFYGVERPTLAKRILPTTWRETGVMVSGKVGDNASYDVGVHSGLTLGTNATDLTAIRSGRTNGSKAKANDPAFTARVDYSPVAGATVGATLNYQADVTQGTGNVSALLTEVHGVVNRGPVTVKGVYANWDVDVDDAAYKSQKGFYIEPSYKVSPKLGVFARYSDLEYAAKVGEQKKEKITTVGANYYVVPNVALKADYQEESVADKSAVNLGVGWSF